MAIPRDFDKEAARSILRRKFGDSIARISFGKKRRDGTMSAKLVLKDGQVVTWSYLTDMV